MNEKRNRGRPRSSNPKRNPVMTHLTDSEKYELQFCASQCDAPERDVIRMAIRKLYESIQEEHK